MRRPDTHTPDLFGAAAPAAGSLGCGAEVAATMRQGMDELASRGMTRDDVAAAMSALLGDTLSVATLNGYCAASHGDREPSLRRAMAFDAVLGRPVLLALYVRKLDLGVLVSHDDALLLEWARLHHEEREIAERRKALEANLRRTRS